nr:hypothetical protein [Tanacetum cinerariifolium]
SVIKLILFPFSLAGAARRLVSKFINEFFPPLRTTNLRNEILNFQQKFDESFHEAWERYKDLLRACLHHGFTELHQLDTFYNALNPVDQDSLNAAAVGNLLEKSPQDALTIIENKSKVRNSRSKPIGSPVNACDINSSSEIAKLTHAVNQQTSDVTTAMMAMLKQLQSNPPLAQVKAVEEICITCEVLIRTTSVLPSVATLSQNSRITSNAQSNQNFHLNELEKIKRMNDVSLKAMQNQIDMVKNELRNEMKTSIQTSLSNQTNEIKNMMASLLQMNIASTSGSGSLSGNTVANPKGELKSITTRSGLVTDGPTVPTLPKSVTPEEDKCVEETYMDPDLAKKIGDPGKFLIPCGFSELKCKALADLGASINLMPLSVWKKLGLPDLIPTQMTLELANRAICTPDGIARDVFVPVGKFTFPADFVVVDYESDPRVPLILGRPFLRTARALIEVHGEEMILRDEDERLTLNMKHDTTSYSNHPHRESVNLINIFNVSKGCNFLSEELPDIDSFNDIHPYFEDDPLSGSTTYSSNSLLKEFTDELTLITYPPDYDDNLTCDIESREIEFLLYQGEDSDLKDSIDKTDLANLDDLLVDSTPEMFTDEQPHDYSFPSRFDVYPDDFLEIESDANNFYDDLFYSNGEKIKEAKLLIDQLDLPCDILLYSEYDSFNSQDFSRDDDLPSPDNEDKVFNPGILIPKKSVTIITRVAQEKNLAISYASLVFEDFDSPLYELLVFKDVPNSMRLLPFSSENEEKVFKPGIYTSEKVKENQKKDKIGSKPYKNEKRGEAGKSQKQLQSIKQEKLKKMQVEGPEMQNPTSFISERQREGLLLQFSQSLTTGARTVNGCKRRESVVEPEIRTIVEMADNRTMAQMLQAPIEGYEDAIVVPPINANNFELKQTLINLVQSNQFTGRQDPHNHLRFFNKVTSTFRHPEVPNTTIKILLFPFSLEGEARIWLDKELPRSILTWEDLISKFINQFFPPSKTTYLRNEITNFLQKPNETFNEAWERFKDLFRQCPHHDFSKLHQLDTFYNALNPNDQDALDSAAGGNFLDKIPRECLSIIESKSKVRYSRSRMTDSRANMNAPPSSSSPSNSFDLQQIVASLEDKLDIRMTRFKKSLNDIKNSFITPTVPIKAVEEVCVTCGANHSYKQCPLTRGNEFSVFHDNIQQFQTAAVGNFIQNRNQNVSNQMCPPGFNQPNQQNNQSRYQGNNFNQNQNRQNNQGAVYQNRPQQALSYQAPAQQNTVIHSKFEAYTNANDANMNNLQLNSSSLPSNTIPNPKGEAKAITTRSGMSYKEPPIPRPGVEEQKPTEETKDTELPTTEDIQPPSVQVQVPEEEPIEKPSIVIPKAKANLPYPFADDLVHMPKFAPMFKKLLNNKNKLIELTKMPLNENCSAVVLKKLPEKLELADKTISKPTGVAENIFVKVGKFYFPADFVVLDFIADPRVSLILGRPFLSTAHAIINVHEREIILRQDQQSLTIQCGDILSIKKFKQINKINFIDTGGRDFDSEEIENFLNDDSIPIGVEDSPFNMEEDILFLERLVREYPSPPHPIIPNHTKSLIEEPKHSFNMGYEHFNTNLVTNDVAESSTKNLVPIPRESKFDNLDEFSGPFIPIQIVEEERIRREHADYINRMEMLFTINSRPHPATIIESFSSFAIPIQESNPHQEEIYVVTVTDDVLPPSVENDDSDEEVDVVDDLRIDNSNSNSNSEHEFFESVDSDFDNPSVPLPPPEPSDEEIDFEIDTIVEVECTDARVKFDVFSYENDDLSYFMFDKVFSLLSVESEDTIFDPANRAICTPAGITRDVFVPVGKFTFPADFVIVDYESDPQVPLILGRPFLRTARALIDVHREEMILHDSDERLTLNMRHDTSSYSNQPHKESINMINIYNNSYEDYLKDLFATNHLSDNLTFSSHTDLTSPKVINPLSGNTTSSSPDHLLEKNIIMLNHDPTKEMDSILTDSVDEGNLADLNNNLVDTIPEMFTDEHTHDYSSPPLYDDVDDDLVELESDNDDVYDDPFDSKEEKIKESKLLIDELDPP